MTDTKLIHDLRRLTLSQIERIERNLNRIFREAKKGKTADKPRTEAAPETTRQPVQTSDDLEAYLMADAEALRQAAQAFKATTAKQVARFDEWAKKEGKQP